MRNDFSVIDALFEMLEEQDDRDDEDNNRSEKWEEDKNNKKTIYTLRRWQESAFLEHAKLILIDASYRNIHEITLESGGVVYLVPEEFYISKRVNIGVQVDKSRELKVK